MVKSDEELIEVWLRDKSPDSQRCYLHDVKAFFAFVKKPLREVTTEDIQAFGGNLGHLSASSQGRHIATIKSLTRFGQRLGYLESNVGRPVKKPKAEMPGALSVLDAGSVSKMIEGEPNPRNRALLRLMANTGLRISEICALRVGDVRPCGDSGQVTVSRKGAARPWTLTLDATVWEEIAPLCGAHPDAPVFRSRNEGGHLDRSMVHRIIKDAAARVGLPGKVSASWIRNSHMVYELSRGASMLSVQEKIGHASLTTTARYCARAGFGMPVDSRRNGATSPVRLENVYLARDVDTLLQAAGVSRPDSLILCRARIEYYYEH